jgi:hypothetical protein
VRTCVTALLYDYHQVKKEYVLATELYRSAEQSGISIRALQKNMQETTATWFKVAGGKRSNIR